ncbi:putative FKBP-type peptidyl-prolyl cis-trans isomerase FkpA precursor [Candidatus Rubidus massiliensis]|nr:MAG: hypothetical protein BGO10_06995 [Chlamydia sp. 32-24]CDZ80434.1 putative FKBP-type peptidyl-prolyl cis-trans isomerase FkpA precursor [Candidatus Rubidus massiliensis]
MLRKNFALLASMSLICTSGIVLGQNATTAPAPATTTQAASVKKDGEGEIDVKKLSEAFGHFIGRNLKTPSMQLDLESTIKGMREGAEGKPAPMSDQEYEMMMLKAQEKAFAKISEENLKAANEFLKQNAKTEGVISIEPDKLQYKILKEGNGAVVQEGSVPLIQYKGTYLDGTVFGNSEEVGGPIKIPLNQTIPGFSKGILGMKEGEKRRLYVHPDKGYGTTGHLPPNSMLIFDVEVIKADAKDQDTAANNDQDDDMIPIALGEDDEDLDSESDQNDSDIGMGKSLKKEEVAN